MPQRLATTRRRPTVPPSHLLLNLPSLPFLRPASSRHVRTDWERIRAGEWRAAKPRLTLKGGQLESADGRLARTPDLRIW